LKSLLLLYFPVEILMESLMFESIIIASKT